MLKKKKEKHLKEGRNPSRLVIHVSKVHSNWQRVALHFVVQNRGADHCDGVAVKLMIRGGVLPMIFVRNPQRQGHEVGVGVKRILKKFKVGMV